MPACLERVRHAVAHLSAYFCFQQRTIAAGDALSPRPDFVCLSGVRLLFDLAAMAELLSYGRNASRDFAGLDL
jgi:hypothetical protein